uniref:LRAT domain-containing protein n=1 Tax=Lates calcarifer TaxID=8187 RepID=A0A4W6F2A7_LATCA
LISPCPFSEIFRGSYQHWAVYIGDGLVVHFTTTGEGGVASLLHDRAKVKKEKLLAVVGTDKWHINNTLDKKYKPFPADNIVQAACVLVDIELPYNVIRFNCEHFANEMRYHKAVSRQVDVRFVKQWCLVISCGMGEMFDVTQRLSQSRFQGRTKC